MYTFKSKLRDLYRNPAGHDIICKVLLQMGLSEKLIANPVVGSLPLSFLKRLAGKRLGEGFFDTLLSLLNQCPEAILPNHQANAPAWWKAAVFYQIYPKSFKDTDGDGIGDLAGILSKLDYLEMLGVDALWLCPIYDSPGDDNGYDIRNYQAIDPVFGTMADFDALLAALHKRGMRLIMDLVVNHTSDEHDWFTQALQNPSSPYRDYYFLRDHTNNWTSFFSGSAWNAYTEQQQYALHLFSKKQMDLNWDNANMRQDIYQMIRWWLGKGVDGFRLDVINYISKAKGLPDGDAFIGSLMGFTGIEHYFHGSRLHHYLAEMRQQAFDPFEAFSVGETPGIGREVGKLLTSPIRGELDMIFSFDHLETSGHERFDIYEYDLNYYKKYITDWMEHYTDTSWMSLFYDNHDNPRMLSKIDHSHKYREPLAKLLAVIQMTLKGTPFLYQGQELGMINQDFRSIHDLRDVESLNKYDELCMSMSHEEAFRRILAGSRDHARTPMQWNSQDGCGFTDGTPWILSQGDQQQCNAEQQMDQKDSVLHFYRQLIALRKKNKSVLVYGSIRFLEKQRKNLLIYQRKGRAKQYLIICNLSAEAQKPPKNIKGQLVLSSYRTIKTTLKPYEARIYKV